MIIDFPGYHFISSIISYKIRSIQTENKVQENSYPKKRDLSYVAAHSLNYKTHDKNKTSAPVSATGADGYLLVEITRFELVTYALRTHRSTN